MSKQKKEWAKRKRRELMELLGNVCNARKGDDLPVLVLTAPLNGEPFCTAYLHSSALMH